MFMKQLLLICAALSFTCPIATGQVPQSANPPVAPPVAATPGNGRQLTPEMIEQQKRSREDRQNMMTLLHISSLREGANGSNKDAPNYATTTNRRLTPAPRCRTRS